VVDEQGFAKYSRLYAGNQVECHSLAEIIESLVALRPNLANLTSPFFLADADNPDVSGGCRHYSFYGRNFSRQRELLQVQALVDLAVFRLRLAA